MVWPASCPVDCTDSTACWAGSRRFSLTSPATCWATGATFSCATWNAPTPKPSDLAGRTASCRDFLPAHLKGEEDAAMGRRAENLARRPIVSLDHSLGAQAGLVDRRW